MEKSKNLKEPHLYTDDTQIQGSCRPGSADQLQSTLSACLDEVSDWMRSNRLQLNTAKKDILWCSTSCRQNHLPSAAVRVGENHLLPLSRQLFATWEFTSTVMSLCGLAYGVGMFCCATTAPQHQTFSVRFCVPFAGRVAGYATSRLQQRNTRRASCVAAPSPSVGAQRRRQTYTSIFSV